MFFLFGLWFNVPETAMIMSSMSVDLTTLFFLGKLKNYDINWLSVQLSLATDNNPSWISRSNKYFMINLHESNGKDQTSRHLGQQMDFHLHLATDHTM